MKSVQQQPKSMIVAGIMSGTSADGVDVALVRVSPPSAKLVRAGGKSKALPHPRVKLLGHLTIPYPKAVRIAVLAAMDAPSISTAELARLHWRLGQFYGDAITHTQDICGIRAALAGVHGQTIYHQGASVRFLGESLRCTWQIGEASETAMRAAMPVISDFRPADMVVGGHGAPLVPIFDRACFGHKTRNRVLQNLGGIANLSALPAASNDLLAFDSGPASVVVDGCMQTLYGRTFDRNGMVAKRGKVMRAVLDTSLNLPYFGAQPPKSCGREQFGGIYVSQFIAACREAGAQDADVIATATALTAESILHAYRTFVWPFLGQRAPLAHNTDYIVAGGGAKNLTLMRRLREGLESLGVTVSTSEQYGVPTQAKEAMAFALLAWLRWHGMPGNVPSATGASKPVLLGRVTLP